MGLHQGGATPSVQHCILLQQKEINKLPLHRGRMKKSNTATAAKIIPIRRHILRAGVALPVAESIRKIRANSAKNAEM